MHPDIKKFWESEGYSIPNSDQTLNCYINGFKHNAKYNVSLISILQFRDKYFFNKNWYSENEMLKIIKLKAFL